MRQEERQHFEAEIDVQSQENSLLVLIRRKENGMFLEPTDF